MDKLCLFLGITAMALTGCGGSLNGSLSSGGSTNVTLLLTSTANGRFAGYGMGFTSITLTDRQGKTASLLSQTQSAEFIHLNGISEPLLTVSVPQGVYISAAITGGGGFSLISRDPATGGPDVSNYVVQAQLQTPVINLPASGLTISGSSMVLSLNLLVSQSATLSGSGASAKYTVTPTFSLSPVAIASQPTNESNGKFQDIAGYVLSHSGESFSLRLSDGPSDNGAPYITYNTDSSTVFEGVSGLSSLAPGMSIRIGAQFQADGSLLATRVYVPDPNAADTAQGPALIVHSIYPPDGFGVFGQLEDGEKLSNEYLDGISYGYEGGTVFQISPAYANLSSLPFPAVFNAASSMAVGQNLSVSSAAIGNYGGGNTTAVTVTLMPQTINGTVSSISKSGDFEIYTVDLASNDSIVELGGVKSVVIYTDSNTQMLNTNPIAVGSVVRFYGLVFNDNDTLRMDCAQINDGVPE